MNRRTASAEQDSGGKRVKTPKCRIASRLVILSAVGIFSEVTSVGQQPQSGAKRETKTNPQERQVELARRWEAIKLAVGRARVVMDMPFFRSLTYWTDQNTRTAENVTIKEGDLTTPLSFKTEVTLVIAGDCRADLSLPEGSLVQIYGDLIGTITIAGQGEIVIGGRIAPEAVINASGIQHVLLGGDLAGRIQSTGDLKVSIGGNLTGTVETGDVSTNLTIHGDLTGRVKPTVKASLLSIDVHGYLSSANLQTIVGSHYLKFDACVAASDRAPGIYHDDDPDTYWRNSYWTILAKK
jgi:cytoskeletal protein CcmA (bactofilin family)